VRRVLRGGAGRRHAFLELLRGPCWAGGAPCAGGGHLVMGEGVGGLRDRFREWRRR
jgi:hypothetical protein